MEHSADHDYFCNLLQDTPEDSILNEDPNLFSSFQQYCLERHTALINQNEQDDYEIDSWEKEYNTWILMEKLLSIRLSIPQDEPIKNISSMSQSEIMNEVMKIHPELEEYLTVKSWLEITAPEFTPSNPVPDQLKHTARLVSDKRNSIKYTTQLDPDASTRQGRSLAQQDEETESLISKTLFEYLRRGKMDCILDFCYASNQFWRASSFLGAIPFNNGKDSGGSPFGNCNTALYKFVCLNIAKDTSIDPYQRASYAIMAGDAENALGVCETWFICSHLFYSREDSLWVYYNSLFESHSSKLLNDYLTTHLNPIDLKHDCIIQSPFPLYSNLTPLTIIESLSKSENPLIRNAYSEVFPILQTTIILNQFEQLFSSIRIQCESYSLSDLISSQSYLRIIVLIVCILRKLDYFNEMKHNNNENDENDHENDDQDMGYETNSIKDNQMNIEKKRFEDENVILMFYIQLLCSSRKIDSAIYYTCQLPSSLQSKSFSKFLSTVNDSKQVRFNYMKMAGVAGLDIVTIGFRTCELVLNNGILKQSVPDDLKNVYLNLPTLHDKDKNNNKNQDTHQDTHQDNQNISSPKDMGSVEFITLQIRALEWLTYNPVQYKDALFWATTLMRRFFVLGNVEAVGRLIESLPESLISPQDAQNALNEPPSSNIKDDKNAVNESQSSNMKTRLVLDTIREYLWYRSLYECCYSYIQFNQKYQSQPHKKGIHQSRTWQKELLSSVEQTRTLCTQFLEQFYQESHPESTKKQQEIQSIREMYAHKIVEWLIQCLILTKEYQPKYVFKSFFNWNIEYLIDVVHLLADSDELLLDINKSEMFSGILVQLVEPFVDENY